MGYYIRLTIAVLSSLFLAGATAVSNSSTTTTSCKCVPSDPCWPSPTTWAALGETLDGRLLPFELPEAVCPNGGAGKETWMVNATEATHVEAALKFAGEHNLKVNVNNTGHAGTNTLRSSSCGALFIHTHHMKGLDFHDSYTPQSCSRNVSHMAVTLGAGEQDDDVFQALAKHNAVTVGGTFDTVGIVGWATSGGHGWLTSSHGQGADNIYEVEVVTPAGDILIANECQNTDLYWATRGGGGGTYGVITKITMKAYPMPQTTQWVWNLASHNGTTATQWWKLVAELHAGLVALNNEGFQGYYTLIGDAAGPWSFGGYFLAYDKSSAEIQDIIAPFSAMLDASAAIASVSMSNVTRFDSWIAAYNGLPKQGADSTDGPGGVVSVTRLLARDDLTGDVDAVAKMFESIGPQADEADLGISSHIIAGSLIASPKHEQNAALNPAWRAAGTHLIVKAAWSDALPATGVQKIQKRMTNEVGRAMRRLSPDAGCYVNECDQYEPDWQYALYGPNYARLRAIKEKYDPAHTLWCRKCVASDDWAYDEGSGSLCRRDVMQSWPGYGIPEEW